MKTFFRLLRFIHPYRAWAVMALLLYVVVLLANIFLMGIAGWFIATMSIAGVLGLSVNYFTPAATIRALAIIRTGGRYGERLVTHEAILRLISGLRRWCFQQLEPLAPAKLQGWHSGELISALRGDMDAIESAYLSVFLPMIGGLLALLVLSLVLYLLHPAFVGIISVMLLFHGLVLPLIAWSVTRKDSAKIARYKVDFSNRCIDNIQGAGELALYGRQEEFAQRVIDIEVTRQQAERRVHGFKCFAEDMIVMGASITVWLVILFSQPLLASEVIAPENLTLLALLALASFEIVLPLPTAVCLWSEVKSAAEHLFSLTDQNDMKAENDSVLTNYTAIPESYDIEFDNVCFAYPSSDQPVLTQFSLSIKQGEHVAITGPSGSGKSSLIHLLYRFWQPQAGKILLGGKSITEYPEENLRQCFAVAKQHPYLFSDTLLANCQLANPSASQADIEAACKIAKLQDFIEQQPSAYHTFVGEHGMKLSGGQQRRLAVAQAILKQAPILLLDEPDEGLDETLRVELLKAVRAHQQGKTLIVITHQADCLRLFDRIIRL